MYGDLIKMALEHLKDWRLTYLLGLIVAVGIGWQGNALADFFLDQRVKKIVVVQLTPLQQQLDKIAQQQQLDRLASLEDRLLAARREQCKAIAEGNTMAKAFYADRMQDLKHQYFDLSNPNRNWEAPPCESF